MKPTNKLLGTIAMMASPFLFLQMAVGNKANDYNTSLGGLFDLVYITGWMCSIAGLQRMQAMGTKKSGNVLLQVQLAFLFLANIWNGWVIFNPHNKSTLFFILDMCWPLSNVCLLAIGILTAITGRIRGWRRYITLMAGLWLPVAFGSLTLLGRNDSSLYLAGIYSTVAWFLLGLMVFTSPAMKE